MVPDPGADALSPARSAPSPGAHSPDTQAALAVLAVSSAVAAALDPRERAVLIARLAAIAEDWERPDATPCLRLAAAQYLRPVLAQLRAEHPSSDRLMRQRARRAAQRRRAPRP